MKVFIDRVPETRFYLYVFSIFIFLRLTQNPYNSLVSEM